jgi:hypothetical protein
MWSIYKSMGVSAAALVLGTALPAEAATLLPSCSTTGANGTIRVDNFNGATSRINLSITVYDSLADGHHVRIRLVTKNSVGTVKNWSWRGNYDGEGTFKTWDTYAEDSSGIFDVGVQVARFEGDSLLNYCTDWA